MRTHEISSPAAAERYFSNTFYGQLYRLFAETLGGSDRSRRSARSQAASPKRRVAQPTAVTTAPRATLLDRLDGWFWRQLQKDREAYLARSRDVFELERRIRALERGEITRYY